MLDLKDLWGNGVDLTDERYAHLSEHPEMAGQYDKLAETLLQSDVVVQSNSDEKVRLFHRFYEGLSIGDKHLCLVVKYLENEAFIITA